MTDSSAHTSEDLGQLRRELEEAREEISALRGRTKFGLVWEDQPEAVEADMAARLPVLLRKSSLDIEGAKPSVRPHLLIEGDNLHALTVLQATHSNSIDVIYIDPPYNTGHEFVYNDKIVGKEDRWRHSAWLSFMARRLRLARLLLKDDGVMFVSIDDHEQANLRLLCDQIFGQDNFVTCMPWVKKYGGGQAKHLYETHEYVMIYAKNKPLIAPFTTPKEVKDSETVTVNGVRYFKYKGWLRTEHGRKTTEDSSILFYEDVEAVKGPGKKAEIDAAIEAGEMMLDRHASGKHEVVKLQPVSGLRKKVPSHIPIAVFTKDGNDEVAAIGVSFDNPKPVELMTYVLGMQVGVRRDAIVLDFFAGSGTTLHALAQLNAEDGGSRQAILVTNNENNICRNVTRPRLQAVLTGKWSDGQSRDALPGTVRFYQTDFLANRRNRDQAFLDFSASATDILAIKEEAHSREVVEGPLTVLRGDGRTIAAVTDSFYDHSDFVQTASAATKPGDLRRAYVFTWSDDGVEAEIAEQWKGWEVRALPAALLAAIRRRING